MLLFNSFSEIFDNFSMYSKSTFPFCEIDKIKASSGLSTFSIGFEYLIVHYTVVTKMVTVLEGQAEHWEDSGNWHF